MLLTTAGLKTLGRWVNALKLSPLPNNAKRFAVQKPIAKLSKCSLCNLTHLWVTVLEVFLAAVLFLGQAKLGFVTRVNSIRPQSKAQ
jgi:hypothetical protein